MVSDLYEEVSVRLAKRIVCRRSLRPSVYRDKRDGLALLAKALTPVAQFAFGNSEFRKEHGISKDNSVAVYHFTWLRERQLRKDEDEEGSVES